MNSISWKRWYLHDWSRLREDGSTCRVPILFLATALVSACFTVSGSASDSKVAWSTITNISALNSPSCRLEKDG